MTATIQVLPDSLINQIAAGEVIENPSSVVKELVENSIDAHATQIEIEIKGGGLQQIVIHDNGLGMTPQDLLLSVERHATSKIRHFTDFSFLLSMGFRGEALASIASISRMKIESAQEGKGAHVLEMEGGTILEQRRGARERGTSIEVNSLFYNVPARKKFQRSLNANVAMIKRTVDLLALAHPEVGLSLKVQDVLLLHTLPLVDGNWQQRTQERIVEVLGDKFFSSLLELSFTEGPFSFRGWIGLPSYAKKTRSGQYLFINQRVVYSPVIASGIRDGYGTSLGEGYFPFFVVYLDIPPDFVDVNVHPQKREVRLRDEFFLKEKVKEAVAVALQGKHSAEETNGPVENFFFSPSAMSFQKPSALAFSSPSMESQRIPEPLHQQEELFSLESISPSYVFHELGLMGHYLLVEMKDFSEVLSRFTKAESEKEALLIIDLQAASARVLFDALNGKSSSDQILSQQLLFPITLDVTSDQMIHISDHIEELSWIGVEARILGQKTVAIDALPFFIKEEECSAFFESVVEELSMMGKIDNPQENHNKRMARRITTFAKAQQKTFAMDEGRALFEKLLSSKERYHDPLGNPTMIRLTKQQIEMVFKNQDRSL